MTRLERQVVGALILPPDAPITEKTVEAVARRTRVSAAEVRRTLEQLAELELPLVHHDVDAKLDIELWIVINLDAHVAFADP